MPVKSLNEEAWKRKALVPASNIICVDFRINDTTLGNN